MVSNDTSPMEIDTETSTSPQTMKDSPMTNAAAVASCLSSEQDTPQLSEEEEARQAIEKLRGEDLSARIEAASKLDAVAKTLGEERTRDVSFVVTRLHMIRMPWGREGVIPCML